MRNIQIGGTKLSQKGVAALEFAVVFPVLFLVMYGMVFYAMLFAAKHTLAESAADGARAAVRFMTAKDDVSARKNAACTQAKIGVEWIEQMGGASVSCAAEASANCVRPSGSAVECLSVTLSYAYAQKPLLPQLPILPAPLMLSGNAVVQIALTY